MNLVIDCSFIVTSILPDELQLKVDEVYNQIMFLMCMFPLYFTWNVTMYLFHH